MPEASAAFINWAEFSNVELVAGTGGSSKTVESAMWKGEKVALLTLRDGKPAAMEADRMARLGGHPHLIKLLGQTVKPTGANVLVTEFARHGALNGYLDELSDEGVSVSERCRITIALQIAMAMERMGEEKLIHCDLAARNVLVFNCDAFHPEGIVVKVCDFGLTAPGSTYFRQGGTTYLPVRWMAPETHRMMKWNYATDVWSFGCVLYEIFADGAMPFISVPHAEIAAKLMAKTLHLERPESCSDRVWALMQQCTAHRACERPRFSEVAERLRAMLAGGARAALERGRSPGPHTPEADMRAALARCQDLVELASELAAAGRAREDELSALRGELDRIAAAEAEMREHSAALQCRVAVSDGELAREKQDAAELRAELARLRRAQAESEAQLGAARDTVRELHQNGEVQRQRLRAAGGSFFPMAADESARLPERSEGIADELAKLQNELGNTRELAAARARLAEHIDEQRRSLELRLQLYSGGFVEFLVYTRANLIRQVSDLHRCLDGALMRRMRELKASSAKRQLGPGDLEEITAQVTKARTVCKNIVCDFFTEPEKHQYGLPPTLVPPQESAIRLDDCRGQLSVATVLDQAAPLIDLRDALAAEFGDMADSFARLGVAADAEDLTSEDFRTRLPRAGVAPAAVQRLVELLERCGGTVGCMELSLLERATLTLPETPCDSVEFSDQASGKLVRVAPSEDGSRLLHSVGNGDPTAVHTIAFRSRRSVEVNGVSAELPAVRVAELLGALRYLCVRTGVRHDIPRTVFDASSPAAMQLVMELSPNRTFDRDDHPTHGPPGSVSQFSRMQWGFRTQDGPAFEQCARAAAATGRAAARLARPVRQDTTSATTPVGSHELAL